MQNNKKDRGMIKWRPFASLPEHMEYISNNIKQKNKLQKKKLSNDRLREMNELVENSIINSTKLVLILYKNGEFYEKECIPISYDDENKMLIVRNNNNIKERISIVKIIDVREI